jgi:hypothetical protein
MNKISVTATTPRKLVAKRRKMLFEKQKRRAKRREDFFKERELGSPSPTQKLSPDSPLKVLKQKIEVGFEPSIEIEEDE